MSRRASLLAKQEKRKPRVRFPDELVFLDNIKVNDIKACHSMLRRASVQLDINGLDTSGLTPLHNAVLEGNLAAVKLLIQHGADVNKKDVDTWTPLHAACANGEADIARYLLSKGASKDIKTNDGERPLDLCDARDFSVISVMLESDTARKARLANSQDDEEDEDDYLSNDGSAPNSSESSPEPLRRQYPEKNDDSKSKRSTAGLVKGMSNLKTVMEDGSSSPPTLSLSPAKKSPAVASRRSPTTHLSPESAQKPPKPAGHSILKKTPQQFKGVSD
ncbi:protein phosphatase 1 regulatory subunit 12C-like [Physella acuta]|uniref:protein phosphatase 1 regulatory subunit 12C-like n=1 Tax=Physella acuta TaxID=109671 RepID=UPI0027DAC512|nr:protein phosphatase 1 regulatory subunit 12C-like [Physella acuta]